ncbi:MULTISPECIES: hypothetical protein [unclassified Sphingomonas]|uniref:hypothetical protein n=1 Tax=unclassified Sphingomonas TaxID=196159 RepID=UPI000AD66DD3|nr:MULTISPECIES: hypothetical protein [unclassified Sphingomonas]
MQIETIVAFLIFISFAIFTISQADGWGITRFPFVISGVFTAFLSAQILLFLLVDSQSLYYYVENDVIFVGEICILLCFLCALGGYYLTLKRIDTDAENNTNDNNNQIPEYDNENIIQAYRSHLDVSSWIIAIVSTFSYLWLVLIGGGLKQFLLEGGNYEITYEGLPVYLIFVVRFIYIAIAIQLFLWCKFKKINHLYLALLFSLIPLSNIIFLFRRSEVLILGVIFAHFMVRYGKIRLNRVTVISCLIAFLFVFRLFPELRSYNFGEAPLAEIADKITKVDETDIDKSEIVGSFLRIDSVNRSGDFQYGAIFYNSIINQYVPSGIFGADFKNSLKIPLDELEYNSVSLFYNYLSPLSFAQVYQQFWYFGALIFALLGAFMAWLERRMAHSPRDEIFYAVMLGILATALTADLTVFVARGLAYYIVVALAVPRFWIGASPPLETSSAPLEMITPALAPDRTQPSGASPTSR